MISDTAWKQTRNPPPLLVHPRQAFPVDAAADDSKEECMVGPFVGVEIWSDVDGLLVLGASVGADVGAVVGLSVSPVVGDERGDLDEGDIVDPGVGAAVG
jgi:hypothetical protein